MADRKNLSPRQQIVRGLKPTLPNQGRDFTQEGQDQGGRAARGLPGKKAPNKGQK